MNQHFLGCLFYILFRKIINPQFCFLSVMDIKLWNQTPQTPNKPMEFGLLLS